MSDYIEEPTNPGLDDGKCALCLKPGLTEEDRCYGCGYTICEDCNVNAGLMGPHLVAEHQDEEEEDIEW